MPAVVAWSPDEALPGDRKPLKEQLETSAEEKDRIPEQIALDEFQRQEQLQEREAEKEVEVKSGLSNDLVISIIAVVCSDTVHAAARDTTATSNEAEGRQSGAISTCSLISVPVCQAEMERWRNKQRQRERERTLKREEHRREQKKRRDEKAQELQDRKRRQQADWNKAQNEVKTQGFFIFISVLTMLR